MKSSDPARIRDVVYVVGAGFSAGLGYPLTKSLLIDVWSRLQGSTRDQLCKIIKFHHPAFNPKRKTSFPDIEQVLTEIKVNLDLFDASRPAGGRFTKGHLTDSHDELLFTISQWFHEIYESAHEASWLSNITKRLRSQNAAIISFNWDLILDQLLFGNNLNAQSYGLAKELGDGPVLLKPHGSLNWYVGPEVVPVSTEKRVEIFHSKKSYECIWAFLRPRGIKSKVGHRYTPLIVPPTYLKDFNRPIFRELWNRCTDVLSTAKKLIFLGYSLPAADLHAQFIFRCGFHNELEGRLRKNGGRYPATGSAKVIIVNPDQAAARRIEAVAGPHIRCGWVPKQIENWLTPHKTPNLSDHGPVRSRTL
jgi:hypothetical protein